MTQTNRLITIPVSHYCEKARWALRIAEIPYIEEYHMPPFYAFATRRVGGKSTPVLITETEVLTDSSDILNYANAIKAIYPTDSDLLKQVKKLEKLFNLQLGPVVRQWAYCHILNNPKLIQPMWSYGVPKWEKSLFPVLFPLMRPLVAKAYKVDASLEEESYQRLKKILDRVSEILSDGRKYLVGDRFSAADLTFATLAAPAIMPSNYGIKIPELKEFPPQMQSKIQTFQETPAGKFVLRLYQEYGK